MSEITVWYDPDRSKHYLEKGDVVEEVHPLTRQYIRDLTEENAKLRDVLKALVVGTNAELCAGRDYLSCKECLMHRSRESCTITDAMELLGCDAYGEPMKVEEK